MSGDIERERESRLVAFRGTPWAHRGRGKKRIHHVRFLFVGRWEGKGDNTTGEPGPKVAARSAKTNTLGCHYAGTYVSWEPRAADSTYCTLT